jgi:hypothetical protein
MMKLMNKKKTVQEIQDEIFRKMPVERKIEISSQLWRLAKLLQGNKIRYEAIKHRSNSAFGKSS